jgi:ribosomal protein S27E
MARISYERGLKCKRCGKIITTIDRFSSFVLCQGCGAYLAEFDREKKEINVANDAKIITVKVTHKLFHDIFEEV